MEEKVQFTRTIIKTGSSLAMTIPPDMLEHLELKEGNEIKMVGDTGKHGRFSAFWNPEKQKQTKLKLKKKAVKSEKNIK